MIGNDWWSLITFPPAEPGSPQAGLLERRINKYKQAGMAQSSLENIFCSLILEKVFDEIINDQNGDLVGPGCVVKSTHFNSRHSRSL